MQLHELQQKSKRITKKRVGRGGLRGKTSGRGTKGQKARAGHRLRPEMRDTIKKLPKLRGHGKNRARTINDGTIKPKVVNLSTLDHYFAQGETVTPLELVKRGVVSQSKGRAPQVKVLGLGDLTKKLSFQNVLFSEKAREAVEKAGGVITQ